MQKKEEREREHSARPVDRQSEDFMMTFHAFMPFFCIIFLGIFISILFVIGCFRLEGGVGYSYYISCIAPAPAGFSPPGKQEHNTHHQSSTWRLSSRRGEDLPLSGKGDGQIVRTFLRDFGRFARPLLTRRPS